MDESATPASRPGNADGRRSPFQGLGYYKEEDAEWFFGRARERNIIGAHVRTARLTLLYAESGVGKSSLLRAGVAARLRNLAKRSIEERRPPKFVPVVFNRWKDDPVRDLIAEIEQQPRCLTAQIKAAGSWAADPRGEHAEQGDPHKALASAIITAATALGGRLVIILDQFDELFAYQRRPEELAEELAGCITSPDVPANFLIAVREDAYGRIGEFFRGRIGDVYGNYLHLEYLKRDAAREAIEGPVRVYNRLHPDRPVAVGDRLTDAVLDEVGRDNLELGAGRRQEVSGPPSMAREDEIEAPFLQLVMERMWECEMDRGSQVLRKATLEEDLGGAEAIVRQHFDRALDGLSGQELNTAGDIFSRLVTPSGVKIAHTATDLAKMTHHSAAEVASVLARLDTQRIVRVVDPAPGTDEERYELFHDKLARPILEWRNQQETGRLEGEKEAAEQEAGKFRRLYRNVAVLTVLCAVALGVAVGLWLYARDQKQKAVSEATTAQSLALAANAHLSRASRPDVALSLALAAYRIRQGDAAADAMIGSLEEFRHSGALAILHGHNDSVNAVAFSPDGQTLASGSSDASIRLWDLRTRRQVGRALEDPKATGIVSVAFSRDGRILASAGGYDPTVRLWDVGTRRQIGLIRADPTRPASRMGMGGRRRTRYAYQVAFSRDGRKIATAGAYNSIALWDARTHSALGPAITCHCGKVASVAFSPDGRVLTSGGYDRTVRLWDVRTHRQLARLPGRSGTIYAVAFSPDGRTIASAGTEPVVRLWSVDRRAQLEPPLKGHRGPVTSLAFTGGRYLASAGADGTVRLWNVHKHLEIGAPLAGHVGTVLGVAFAPNGRALASAGTDGTIRLWEAQTQHRLGEPLPGQAGKAFGVAISHDGSTFASASTDGKIRLWNAHLLLSLGPPLTDHGGRIRSVAFSPDGNTLAAGADSGRITLWNWRARKQSVTFDRQGSQVRSVTFSPDGHFLAEGDKRGVITLWDLRGGHVVRRVSTGKEAVNSVIFSPDGSMLASAGDDWMIRLWGAPTLTPLYQVRGGKGPVHTVAFSPNGRILASGGDDKRIRLWGTLNHTPLGSLAGSTGAVFSLAFSPYGGILASAGSDDAVRLWNVPARTQLGAPLTGHSDAVYGVAFTPDGRALISGSSDATIRVWDGIFWRSLKDLEAQVCPVIGTGLSRTEWPQYAPAIPYRPSCSLT